jgi:hypothetical protein
MAKRGSVEVSFGFSRDHESKWGFTREEKIETVHTAVSKKASGAIESSGTIVASYHVRASLMLTKVLAIGHGKDRIRTNCICPGSVRTEMFNGSIKNFAKKMSGQSGAPSSDQIFQRAYLSEELANPMMWQTSHCSSPRMCRT